MVPGHGAPVAFQDSTAGALCVMLAGTAPAGGYGVWVPLLGCVGRRAFPFTRGRAATRMRRSKNRLPVLATPTSGHFSRSTQTMALVGGADVAGGQSGERRPRRYHCQSRGCDASRARGRPPSPQTRNTDPNGRHRASPIRKQRRLAGRTDRDLRRQSAAPRHAFAVCGGSTETPRQMA